MPSNEAHPGEETFRDVRCVFFDVGGTLLTSVPSASEIFHGALARRGHGISREAIVRVLRQPGGVLSLIRPVGRERTAEYYRDFNARMVEHMGVPWDDGLLEEIGGTFERATWRLFPDVADSLKAIRSAGYRLGIISNATHALPRMLEDAGLAGLFDTITYSFDTGAEKPDPRIFRRAVAQVGATPEQAVHVGDSYDADYLGARNAGLHAVLLMREGDPPEPCPHVRSLQDVVRILERARSRA